MKHIVVVLSILISCGAAAQSPNPATPKVPVFDPALIPLGSESAFDPNISAVATNSIPAAPVPAVTAISIRVTRPQSSRPAEFKRFPSNKLNRALVGTEFLARGLDAMSTYQKLNDSCGCYREAARLFGLNLTPVFKSQGGAYAYSFGVAAAYSLISYKLWNAGERHARRARLLRGLSRGLLIGDSSMELATAVHNLTLTHGNP